MDVDGGNTNSHTLTDLINGQTYTISIVGTSSSDVLPSPPIINPRRACAARVTVVVPCVCVSVCPGLASATHATTRPSRHTYGLSIVLAPE